MSPKVRSAFFCGVLAAALAAVPLSAVAEEVNAMGAQQTEVVASDTFTRAGDAPQAAVAENEAQAVTENGDHTQATQEVEQSAAPQDPAADKDETAPVDTGSTSTESTSEANSTEATSAETDAPASTGSESSAAEQASEPAPTPVAPQPEDSSTTAAAATSGDTAAAAPASDDSDSLQNIYRLYNPYSGEHLYTADLAEAKGLVGYGWAWEGVGWVSSTSSGDAVIRLYNPYNGEHLYTLSESEASFLASIGWRREGRAWLSSGTRGVLREFNPYETVGTHNYTLSTAEDEWLGALGWKREGVAWYSLDHASLPVEPFWATGPSGRWWVQRDGSFASGRVIEPNEDGNPGIRAYATSSNGHVVRGAEVVDGRTVVANASTGELPESTGWWESSAPTGSAHRYMIEMGSDGLPYAKTGRFVDGGSAYYGVPGAGYIAVGRARVGNIFVLTDGNGRLNESTGFIWFQAADDSSTCLYRMGAYGPNGLVGARADGFFGEDGNTFYANPSSGRLNRSGVFYANGAWWRAVDWGGCFSCGSWQDMAAKAQNYRSSTNYLILVDCWSNRTAVYQWDNGWYAVKEWACTTGANNCTVKGEFATNLKGYSFGRGFTCYYFTQFYGDYLFHSVLYYQNSNRVMDGRLGINASHGCVRLAIENAKWICDTIPRGTKVVTY